MKIAFIGKFKNLYDEEYIALSFEYLGYQVKRIPQHYSWFDIKAILEQFKPDILLYCKWEQPKELDETIDRLKKSGLKTVCWLFDVYFNYTRETFVKTKRYFKSDYVFTTDGGQQKRFEELGINHICVRQGIFQDECLLLPFQPIEHEITFVGSDNPVFPERSKLVKDLNAHWVGKKDTGEVRGIALNKLYTCSRIVIGDSWYSAHYWSNRIVETLGRGGFLIHQEVEGLNEAYPYLVTYKRGDIQDLKNKIKYYQEHEDERHEIIRKNFEWVRDNYICAKQCQRLLSYIS